MTMIDAAELKELIREYGRSLDDDHYQVLYNFGIWYADKQDAQDVILSNWTPNE